MMPSVIPARLQFQCGHAALVTLPRVKGETTTQRNDRVAREKSAALTRQCDFCAPSVAVLELPSTVVDVAHVELAVSDVAESTPVADLAVVVTNVSDIPSDADMEPSPEPTETDVVEAEEVEVEVTPEPAAPEALQAEVVIEETVVAYVEEAPVEEPAVEEAPVPVVHAPEPSVRPARKPRARRQPAPKPAPIAPTPARARRAARVRVPAPVPAPVIRGHRFVIEYQIERVIRASSIRDALRQASALGATDLIAITRAD